MNRLILGLLLLTPFNAFANGHAYGFLVMKTADLKTAIADAGGLEKIRFRPRGNTPQPVLFRGEFSAPCSLSLTAEGQTFAIRLTDPHGSPLRYALRRFTPEQTNESIECRGEIDMSKVKKGGPPVLKDEWEQDEFATLFIWIEFLE